MLHCIFFSNFFPYKGPVYLGWEAFVGTPDSSFRDTNIETHLVVVVDITDTW